MMWNYLARSTLKREFASSLMYWLVAMATVLIFKAPTWDQAYRIVSDFMLPIVGMATAAFGADFVAKQTNIAGPSQPDGGNPPPPGGNGNP